MIGNRDAIRHAYENVLTASARLAAFATCEPTDARQWLINTRQQLLATNDLVIFAINARRLMDSTNTLGTYQKVTVMAGCTEHGTDKGSLIDTPFTKIVILSYIINDLKSTASSGT
jgi:hypothetical protein